MQHTVLKTCVWAIFSASLLVTVQAAAARGAEDAPPTADQLKFFETNIRPLLVTSCYQCHGPEKQKGGLRVDSRAALLEGGSSAAAVVPGKPEASLLVTAVSHTNEDLKMPPKEKLSDKQIAHLTEWVKMGAPFPSSAGAQPSQESSDIARGREFWSFKPPVAAPLPVVQDEAWVKTPIDRFVLAKLEAAGLHPVPAADKRSLIRRATFDLTGLPPTPAEIDAFLADSSSEAFAKVVDRLLSSPQYGERWGRHWLDTARYSDSNGLDENIAHGNAWRYRDYVVAALNKDKPYDQFVIEQLAGDLLPTTDPAIRHERLVATGFLSLGAKVLAEADKEKMEMDIIDEQVDTLGRAFMGLTLGCARCHDHKFDPIRTDDYYGIAGVFKSTRTMESFKTLAKWNENSLASDEEVSVKAAWDKQVAERKESVQKVVNAANEKLKVAATPPGTLPAKPEEQYPAETKAELKRLRDELKKFEDAVPVLPSAMGVAEGKVVDLAVNIRGNHLSLGKVVPRRIPLVLASHSQPKFDNAHSGRLELAQWLTRADHPLTGRVMVNRVWRGHFGKGLSRSTDNFGKLGEPPTNPALLDWLAVQFVEANWSMKALHRLIMLSSTYQTGSSYDARAIEKDPENALQWRMDIRRLEAEEIRDTLLAVSDGLDLTMGGSILPVKNREYIFDHTSIDRTKYDSPRRSLYMPIIRNNVYDVFQLFDFADPSVLNGNRSTTTVALQALFMMNSELVAQAADRLAGKVLSDGSMNDAGRVARLYSIAYGRPPTETETAKAALYIENFEKATQMTEPDSAKRRAKAWGLFCQVIMSANEFIYVR